MAAPQTVDFLRAVRDGREVGAAEVQAFVRGLVDGAIPDYQASAFLMAVTLRGLSPAATVALTLAMRDSGATLTWPGALGRKIDKHSTGGVGDKVSLALAPWVAACGVAVPMMSGRGLGHTGGTVDKMEAIPGFDMHLPSARLEAQLRALQVCMMGQGDALVPADRKLYALRDVTATVESLPLIVASILAKKLATGSDALVLDVKVGRGAFMPNLAAARPLAERLLEVSRGAGLPAVALLTDMDQPLGTHIGNALEVREAVAILRGEGPADSTALTLTLAAEMLCLAGAAPDGAEARARLQAALHTGAALDRLRALIAAQGGDAKVVDDPTRLPTAPNVSLVAAPATGVVQDVNPYPLAQIALRLGAGRARVEDAVDPSVGLVLCRRRGDRVARGAPLVEVHHRGPLPADVPALVTAAMPIGAAAVVPGPLVLARLEAL